MNRSGYAYLTALSISMCASLVAVALLGCGGSPSPSSSVRTETSSIAESPVTPANTSPSATPGAVTLPMPTSQATVTSTPAWLDVEKLILSIPPLTVPPSTTESTTVGDVEKHDYGREVNITCLIKENRVTNSLTEITVLAPNPQTLWPGSLVQGKSIGADVLDGITLDRTPGTITVDGLPLPKASIEVEKPTKATVQDAVKSLLPDEGVAPSARISYEMSEAYSLEEVLISAGASVTLPGLQLVGTRLGGSITWNPRDLETHHIVVRFVQPYYTVTFEPPRTSVSFFQNVSLETASRYMGPENPPTYISSVTYGRMLIADVSSKRDAAEVVVALSGILTTLLGQPNGGEDSPGPEIDTTYRKLLAETDVKVFAVGGYSDDVMRIITDHDFSAYFSRPVRISRQTAEEPIFYRINYLRENQVAKAGYTTAYQMRSDCKDGPLPRPALSTAFVSTSSAGSEPVTVYPQNDSPMYIIAEGDHASPNAELKVRIRQEGNKPGLPCLGLDGQEFRYKWEKAEAIKLNGEKWRQFFPIYTNPLLRAFCPNQYFLDTYLNGNLVKEVAFKVQ